ncbi:MAG: hypothetical protein CO118_00405 [Flavobacteriales bacterium CG_4_9_14_3_um_filter_32_8]|nr:MAG: hypothetical protein CO118_00405 [Flavobacteriales bacterium CG_4_9_14_3_um_filter_32_8]
MIFYSCKTVEKSSVKNCHSEKIKFDISKLDDKGLLGNENGKVSVDYEFCIPNNQVYLAEVLAIDLTLKNVPSTGKSKCGADSFLIMGNTFHSDFRLILCKIANLDYVKEINQTHWE